MSLLLFEFKKLFRTRVLLVVVAGTLLLIGALFIRNVIQQDTVTADKIEWFSGYMQEVTGQNRTDAKMLEDHPDEVIERRLEIGVSLQKQLNELISFIEKGAWQEELQQEIVVYKTAIAYKDARGNYTMSNADMEDEIRINERLLALQLAKEDRSRSIQPPLFMKQMVSLILNPFGFIILLVLVGTVVTREFEDYNIQMIYTYPIPKWRYVLIKFTGMLTVGVLWISIIFFVSYLLPSLVSEPRENSFKYPLLLATGEILDVDTYVKAALLYSAGVLCFVVAAVTLIGFLFRQTIISSIVVVAIFIGGWMGTRNGLDRFWNPFTYVSENEAILTRSAYYPGGLIVLVGFAIVLLVIAMWGNQRRGIS